MKLVRLPKILIVIRFTSKKVAFFRMWDRLDPEFHRHLDQTVIRKDEPLTPDHYLQVVLDMYRDLESDFDWHSGVNILSKNP